MSGPVTLRFGPFAFEALGFSYQELGRNVDTQWAEIRVTQGWDRLQYLGPTKEVVDVKGVLFPESLGGLSQIDGIRSMAISGAPQYLASLSGNIYGIFVVVGIKEDQSYFNAVGTPRKDRYSLQLRRYPGAPIDAVTGITRLFTGGV